MVLTGTRLRPSLALPFLFVLVCAIGYGDADIIHTAIAADATESRSFPASALPLPNEIDSVKFGVIGDFATGERAQYQLAEQMASLRQRFKYDFVVTVGDNLYGSEEPEDFREKFELPYKPLLDAGVKFYASLGNHDSREQRFYELFNMGGRLYYTFRPKADVRFFALDSTYLDPEQIQWLERELKSSGSVWKIVFFHHPLYSSGRRHGSDRELREVLEPLFLRYNVSVVLTGHDHFYERVKPQKGIPYFVVGSGGKLRDGNIDRSTGLTAKGFDTDLAFMVGEITGDRMYFTVISRRGAIVDSGVLMARRGTSLTTDHDTSGPDTFVHMNRVAGGPAYYWWKAAQSRNTTERYRRSTRLTAMTAMPDTMPRSTWCSCPYRWAAGSSSSSEM
jgi:predicted MPP superfamily phosphohydrolase